MAKRKRASLFAPLTNRAGNVVAFTSGEQTNFAEKCRSWNVLAPQLSHLTERECLVFLFLEWESSARPIIMTRLRYRYNQLRMERENRELFGTPYLKDVV